MQTILIADESNVTLHVLTAEYIKAGFTVRTVSTENELKTALYMNEFQLILLSLNLCKSNPFEIIEYIRGAMPSAMILLMATSLSISETIAFMKAGVSDCVVKPFDAQNLLKKTNQLFEAREKAAELNKATRGLAPFTDISYGLSYEMGADNEANPLIREIDTTVSLMRNFKINALISGETGTGKTLYAKRIHFGEATKNSPFVSFNCESVLADEMQSALLDRLERSQYGTLYLKELDKMPITLQTKLEMILNEKRFEKESIGKVLPFNARIIAALTISPEQAMATGKLKKELYYLLSEVRLDIPPLRMCKDRFPGLCRNMLSNLSRETNMKTPLISIDYENALTAYDWPGNVRELANTVKYSFLISQGNELTSSMLPLRISRVQSVKDSISPKGENDVFDLRDYLKQQEMKIILSSLEKFDRNRAKTAQYLQISERSLRYKLEEYNNNR